MGTTLPEPIGREAISSTSELDSATLTFFELKVPSTARVLSVFDGVHLEQVLELMHPAPQRVLDPQAPELKQTSPQRHKLKGELALPSSWDISEPLLRVANEHAGGSISAVPKETEEMRSEGLV